jgi:hypothetical protein
MPELINNHLCHFTYIELGILRDVIDRLVPREQWEEWKHDVEFMKECRALIRTING